MTTPCARADGKSLNEAAVAALAEGAGVTGAPRKRRDLGDIAGTWKADKALLEEAEAIVLPFVVVGELRAGFAHGRRQAENERVLRRFLLKDGVRVLFADDQTTHHYASLFRQLRKQGTPVPTNDMWLAALVLQHNLALRARDKHFDHLPQLVRA